MKKFMILGIALCGCVAHGQSSLDQDPKERALSESIFSHPPASSVGRPNVATPTPIPKPTPVPAPTPVPDLLSAKSSAWIDIRLASAPPEGAHDADDDWYTFNAQSGTVNSQGVEATLQIVLVDDRMKPAATASKTIVLKPGTGESAQQISIHYISMKNARDWAARLTSKDGKTLAVKASQNSLEQEIAQPTWWTSDDWAAMRRQRRIR